MRVILYLSLMMAQGALAARAADMQEAAKIVNDAAMEANPEVERQKDGKFPRLERQHALGAIQRAWDKAPQQAGAYSTTYSQQEVIRLRLREFMTTTVILPSWEIMEDIIVGDATTFEATRANDHVLLLKPKEFIGADSNITVVGKSGLVYTFYVRSEGFNSEQVPDLRVHVHVPGDVPMSFGDKKETGVSPVSGGTKNKSEEYPATLPPRIDRLNFKWSMAGDVSIAPRQVFSDGVRTWFNFGEKLEEQDLPVIARVMDGVDTPVNTRIEGNLVIAETVGVFTLRNGSRTVCVYPSDHKDA